MIRIRLMVLCWAMVLVLVPQRFGYSRVYTGDQDLTQAWQQYLAQDAVQSPTIRFPFSDCFRRSAVVNQLPETLLLAVARGESDFNPNARSRANAHGLMQILWPGTAKHLGLNRLSQLYDPCTNVDAGARYLKELLQQYQGNLHLALAAYNYGPGRIPADADIPAGAEWYSGYIYRHLNYVLGQRRPVNTDQAIQDYFDEGKLDLIIFSEPYRAEAFVKALERDAPELRIDWFRAGDAKFKVVLLNDGTQTLEQSKAALARAGFSLPGVRP